MALHNETTTQIASLRQQIRTYMSDDDVAMVERALHLVLEACGIVEAGERLVPPLEYALGIADILASMHMDAAGVAAGLVFEAADADLVSLEEIEEGVGSATSRVVGSMERFNILERKKMNATAASVALSAQNVQTSAIKKGHDEREEGGTSSASEKKPRVREALRRQQAETVRKMFVAMAEDPRVVSLKLAYRLFVMRHMSQPDYQGDRQEMLATAEETREIYAPLAGRLGMSRVEGELEDLTFQLLEPEKYQWVKGIVEAERIQWRSYVDQVCEILRNEMKAIGVRAEVSGRVKRYYSFYRKLERNAGDVDGDFEVLKETADVNQIHDLIAFRILVDTTPDCYVALGHVHSLWKPKEGRIKDYIANPKPNGYSALHTTVFCQDNQLVEIQIRTHTMHEMAEYGVAMHWHYKDVGDNASSTAKELLTWINQLAEWQHEIKAADGSDSDFVDAIKDDLFQEQIFIFTPKGEVKDLPVGSTPLDFAYRIHSKIGDSCAGARIITHAEGPDGGRLLTRMVPLDYELKSGEIVDIVTNRTAHPTRDWLSFARTAAARNKIRRYLKIHERDINIQIGKERLDKVIKAIAGLRGMEVITEDLENWLCQELHMDSFEDILSAIGADDMRPHGVAVKIQEYFQGREGRENREESEEPVLPTVNRQPAANLQVAGVDGLLTRLANCCCPLPGDEIAGFISRGKGVIVHRADCPNVVRLRERSGERFITVSWQGMSQPRYHVPIIVFARDRAGLIRDIATAISEYGLNLLAINTHANSHQERILVTATLEMNDLEVMPRVFKRLEKVKDVLQVERDMGHKRAPLSSGADA
ncbi:(p)ppGpp synthetase [Ktedonospora formicarum]|uniref:(P)ppGpp synthetase n=1 Tax=Ktedonospora formicarum TaxID=2778364 RepID=A0A8J3HV83_9CHLR|nr:(p)ppGpp synthetase [Ktedonospora formicarum]